MTPEEVKQFVKDRLEYQLHNSGLEDISVYMNRFDTLYEQGKMEHLMPTANQKHIVEDIPFTEWENEYISIHNRYADLAEKELSVVEYEILLGMEPAQVSVDGLMEMMNSGGELWNYPMEEKEHCLQENIPVVTVRDGEEHTPCTAIEDNLTFISAKISIRIFRFFVADMVGTIGFVLLCIFDDFSKVFHAVFKFHNALLCRFSGFCFDCNPMFQLGK